MKKILLPTLIVLPLFANVNGMNFNSNGENNSLALHKACEEGDIKTVRKLIADGTSVNTKDWLGYTPLHIATKKNYTDIAKLLIQNHAVVDIQSGFKDTPLHFSSSCGNKLITTLLIRSGASINAENANGCTPLYEAIRKNHPQIIPLLMQNGASIEIQGKNNKLTPALLPALHGNLRIIKLLMSTISLPPTTLPLKDHIKLNLQEESIITLLENFNNFEESSSNSIVNYIACDLTNLAPHSKVLAILVAQSPLIMQRKIVRLWIEQNTQESSSKLKLFIEAHHARYLEHLKNTKTMKLYQKFFIRNPKVVKFFDHIRQAKTFSDLDQDFKASIDKTIKRSLAYYLYRSKLLRCK